MYFCRKKLGSVDYASDEKMVATSSRQLMQEIRCNCRKVLIELGVYFEYISRIFGTFSTHGSAEWMQEEVLPLFFQQRGMWLAVRMS